MTMDNLIHTDKPNLIEDIFSYDQIPRITFEEKIYEEIDGKLIQFDPADSTNFLKSNFLNINLSLINRIVRPMDTKPIIRFISPMGSAANLIHRRRSILAGFIFNQVPRMCDHPDMNLI